MRNRNHVFQFHNADNGVPVPVPGLSDVNGPFSHLNPTRAVFHNAETDEFDRVSYLSYQNRPNQYEPSDKEASQQRIGYFWTSRNNRKGRHALAIYPSREAFEGLLPDEYLYQHKRIRANLTRMFTTFPIWDISYLVALTFVIGSVFWITNGILTLLSLTEDANTSLGAGSLGAEYVGFVATIIFVIANVLQMLEKLNENRCQCFGWAFREIPQEETDQKAVRGTGEEEVCPGSNDADQSEDGGTIKQRHLCLTPVACEHHHANKNSMFDSTEPRKEGNEGNLEVNDSELTKQTSSNSYGSATTCNHDHSNQWKLVPSYHDLRLYHIHDISFFSCSCQLLGSIVGWFGNMLKIPHIYYSLSTKLAIGISVTPRTMSGSFFTAAGLLFCFETQPEWYKPALTVLGWYAGLFTLIGGVGFTLSPPFGILSSNWAQYQSAIAGIWSSSAFLMASLLLLYESLEKYSVKEVDLEDLETSESQGQVQANNREVEAGGKSTESTPLNSTFVQEGQRYS